MLLAGRGRTTVLACTLLLGMAAASARVHGEAAAAQNSADFAISMAAAMARMDRDMMTPSSGNPDRDFARMMIPHHQGAIDMAEAELRFGHDPVLRRLAEGIIVEQQQEIVLMRQSLDAMPPASPTAAATPHAMTMEPKK